MYNITIIGEAVKGLSPDFRDRNPQIPWRQIAGMRDKLVHDYRQINVVQVWRVVQVDIPELLVQIETLLPS
ncbi:HepT-like ribonuclease domain-containing protein [Planktothricoides raciborskii]|uniref:HepT-like ribonuclease domain-containing protein n=1 Tax=Planktothricoides raciborskii TaxID=132608 RepID=UPI0018EFD2E7|nr:HepT-like ribonuclease domain-containing protein [Planktothricoides raciborskii]